ncbi:MAG: 50S ribosomal protein L15 [bacterium]|nr:50S ribosomal protein L15 [Candidatus Jorgensenbacteria bacterium]
MQLNELKPKNAIRKSQKRVGRGGKRGTTSGHGQKGQKSRAGHRIRPAERDLLMRIPKLRGVKNKPKREVALIFNVGELTKVFPDGIVSKSIIAEKGLTKGTHIRVKILSGGEIKKPITIDGVEISAGAKAKIEKAGGTVK